MDPLLQALLTLVSGAVGAGIGAAAALRRFKRERAFDHRVEWYRETVRSLSAWAEAIQDWYTVRVHDLPDDGRYWSRINELGDDASHRLLEAPLYATPAGFRLLRDLEIEFRSFAWESGDEEENLEQTRAFSINIKETARGLAHDGRKEVGLEALPIPDDAKPVFPQRQSTSFTSKDYSAE